MPCFKPLSAYHTFNKDGTRSIVFGNERTAGCDGTYVDLPCGQCIGCRLERSRRWAVRIMHEAQSHQKNSFLTLTYDEKNLPGNSSLKVEDFQLFMKRLRRGSSGPIRFFHCGEYGEQTSRPHYHCILFGEDFFDDRKPLKKTPQGHTLYESEKLSETWGLGHANIGELTFESAAYVARYCLKKVTGEKADEHYQGRKPEYVTMSRRPGIGGHWYDRFHSEVYPSDTVVMRGKEMLPPPFYDKLLERSDPLLFEKIKQQRKIAAHEFANSEDSSSRRLLDREKVKTETVKQTLKRYV